MGTNNSKVETQHEYNTPTFNQVTQGGQYYYECINNALICNFKTKN